MTYHAPMNTMQRNVWLLAVCQALMMTGGVLFIATAALVGQRLAADKSLASLPVAIVALAAMATTIPAALFMRHAGRRAGFIAGVALGLVGAGVSVYAVVGGSFAAFCLAAAFLGAFNGFGTYYRFAAVDTATADYKSRAISYVMAGGVAAALVGPNLASWTGGWLAAV